MREVPDEEKQEEPALAEEAAPEPESPPEAAPEPVSVPEPAARSCFVTVNGERVELMGKERYIFVDIFDRITFDLTAGQGRAIATLVNGDNAQFSQELKDGDRIDLYWKQG